VFACTRDHLLGFLFIIGHFNVGSCLLLSRFYFDIESADTVGLDVILKRRLLGQDCLIEILSFDKTIIIKGIGKSGSTLIAFP